MLTRPTTFRTAIRCRIILATRACGISTANPNVVALGRWFGHTSGLAPGQVADGANATRKGEVSQRDAEANADVWSSTTAKGPDGDLYRQLVSLNGPLFRGLLEKWSICQRQMQQEAAGIRETAAASCGKLDASTRIWEASLREQCRCGQSFAYRLHQLSRFACPPISWLAVNS